MKKNIKYYAVSLALSASLLHPEPQEVFSRTFMLTRPASYDLAMDQQLWHNVVYHKPGPIYGALQFIPYYQSSRSLEKNARYFLFNRKDSLLVAGDDFKDLTFSRDVRAEWVNLPSNFKGSLSLCPTQRQIGFTLIYNQDLKTFFDIPFLKDWAFGIQMPVTMVENNIGLKQSNATTDLTITPTQKSNIYTAFDNPDWSYSKIACTKQRKTNIPYLKLTVGRSLMHRDAFQIQSYTALEIPIATHHDPAYLFSPQVGFDRHVGIGGAVLIQILLNRNPENIAWTFYSNLEGLFYVRNKQFRTFDLKDKPWSRYLQYVRKDAAPGTAMPGVNLLTFPVLVRTFGVADFSFGWRINTAPFEFEIGYDLWGHGGERVELRNKKVNTPFNRCGGGLNEFGIAGSGTRIEKGQTVAATSSTSTIQNQCPDDTTFIGINDNDLDFCSAQAGSAVNHKIHVAIGIQQPKGHPDSFGGFGFFFDFPQKNASLANFGCWFKIGSAF